MKKSLTIIDTFGFLFRAYYALPSYLKSKKGFPTNMLTGFTRFISSLNSEYKTDLLLFALDSKGENFRKEIDSSYKQNRVEIPEDLLKQLGVAIDWIDKMGFKKLSINGYEADDIVASIAKVASKEGYLVKIVSHDKDLYQLIDDEKIVMIDPIKKSVIDENGCFEKYGVKPSQFCDYQALIGDSADNIAGVKGIGPKNAQKLITDFGSIEKIYENINLIKPDRIRNLLIDGKESAFLSKKLVSLKADLFEHVDFSEFSLPNLHPILSIANELMEYDIKDVLEQVKKDGFLLNVHEEIKVTKSSFEAIAIVDETKLFNVINSISKDTIVAFDTETNSLDTKEAKIVGFSFAYDDKKAYYVPINHNYLGVGEQISEDVAKKAIEKLLEYKIVGHNLKFDFSLLKNLFGHSKKDNFIDTMILSWLINPESKHSLDFLMQKYFDYEMKSFKSVVGKSSDFSQVSIDEAT
ncbi:MAG: DNA polymerase I, partial [Campylobacterales bacterium]|nr:DNA polymerase I [Campylobacterales bacterium]